MPVMTRETLRSQTVIKFKLICFQKKRKKETIDFDFLPKTFQSENFLFYFDCKRLRVTVVVDSWIILFWFLCLTSSERKVFFISAGCSTVNIISCTNRIMIGRVLQSGVCFQLMLAPT